MTKFIYLLIGLIIAGVSNADVKPDTILGENWDKYCSSERERLLARERLNLIFSGQVLKKLPGDYVLDLDGISINLPFKDLVSKEFVKSNESVSVLVTRSTKEKIHIYIEPNEMGSGYWGAAHAKLSEEVFGKEANPVQLRVIGFSITPHILLCTEKSAKSDAKNLAALMSKYRAAATFGSGSLVRKIELRNTDYIGYLICNESGESSQIDFMLGNQASVVFGGYSTEMSCKSLH